MWITLRQAPTEFLIQHEVYTITRLMQVGFTSQPWETVNAHQPGHGRSFQAQQHACRGLGALLGWIEIECPVCQRVMGYLIAYSV